MTMIIIIIILIIMKIIKIKIIKIIISYYIFKICWIPKNRVLNKCNQKHY